MNHNGNVAYANEYLDSIIKADADGAIFHIREQSFYQNPEKAKLALPDEFYFHASKKLKKYKKKLGISLSDPRRLELCEKFQTDFYKIFSKDILDASLVEAVRKTKKKIFVSTGMSDLAEIKKFMSGIKSNKKQITLIHTQLSNDVRLTNLKAIPVLKNQFNVNVAYGNHAENTSVLYTAVAFEPTDILFYVKGNKIKKHIDEPHAIPLERLSETIHNLRELAYALGEKKKIKMNNQLN